MYFSLRSTKVSATEQLEEWRHKGCLIDTTDTVQDKSRAVAESVAKCEFSFGGHYLLVTVNHTRDSKTHVRHLAVHVKTGTCRAVSGLHLQMHPGDEVTCRWVWTVPDEEGGGKRRPVRPRRD